MGLTKSLRLLRTGDFARVRAEGRSFPGRYVVVSVLGAPDIVGWKCGLISSKKTGIAVVRNRLRRRLREMVRAEAGRLKDGQWFVLILRWKAAGASFEELKKDWTAAARRAGLFQ